MPESAFILILVGCFILWSMLSVGVGYWLRGYEDKRKERLKSEIREEIAAEKKDGE